MSLIFHVLQQPQKSILFGSPFKFEQFLIRLADNIHGHKYGFEYSKWCLNDNLIDVNEKLEFKQVGLSDKFCSLDIYPFYTLSSTYCELSEHKCKELYYILDRHEQKILKCDEMNIGFKSDYKRLSNVFKCAQGNSQNIAVLMFFATDK
jgi:hypothetical protein